MQSQPSGNYKWILNYKDHFTKFVQLRPLERKSAIDVANTLLDIFLMSNGAPSILQSDNGREFVNKVITELTKLWPTLKLVHGRPRHPQSQGSVEKSNDEVHKQLVSWMCDNNCTNLAQGLKFVQFQKNRSHHSRLQISPCEAVYGKPATTGLTSSSLPSEILSLISTEEDLQPIINEDFTVSSNMSPDNEDDQGQDQEETSESIEEREQNQLQEESTPDQDLPTEAAAPSVAILPDADGTTNPPPVICSICETMLFDAVVCSTCSTLVHAECSNSGEYHLCCLISKRRMKRAATHQAQEKQAKKMVQESEAILQPLEVGDSVRVPIPRVDRGRADPANLLGVITSVDNGKYQIGTAVGHLEKAFSRSQVEKCAQKLLKEEVIPDRVLSLRSAVAEESIATGQGLIRCNCKTGCFASRCKCKRNRLICNSRCHNSLSCKNK